MKLFSSIILFILFVEADVLFSQNIGDFVSVFPEVQSEQFVFPSTHNFQKIVEVGDVLTEGGIMPIRPDFAGYVPISGSSIDGYLSVNSETNPGGNTVFDINFNSSNNLWVKSLSQKLDFSPVYGTSGNCSGTVTPWNTIISCEEKTTENDNNLDNYYDLGWNVEINPATKTVIRKHWAMGNFAHENVTIHPNHRTVYQGADSNPGYLYKFVADAEQNLSAGLLYVYTGSKNGPGNWILIDNTSPQDRNSTLAQSLNVSGTIFNGIEDVEIGPDGLIYFAVKGENRVYRFQDSDPISGTSLTMETYVGASSYDINHELGITSVSWGGGNDNLAFDGQGNLWVFQDGGNNYIWVVESGHTQANPKVKLFGIAPIGSEPTGITFTPDYKYLFMSIQHPGLSNNANQIDAEGNILSFSKGIVLVIANNKDLGEALSLAEIDNTSKQIKVYPNPLKSSRELFIQGEQISNIKLFTIEGKLIFEKKYNGINKLSLSLDTLKVGLYFVYLNNIQVKKILINSSKQ